MIAKLRSGIRGLLDREDGVAGFELALLAPVLVGLLLGSAETGLYLMAHQNLSTTAWRMGDLVSQQEKLTVAKVQDLMTAVKYVANPDDFRAKGVVIVSAITNDRGTRKIAWQQRGAGDLTERSRFGEAGRSAQSLPGQFTGTGSMANGETVIAVEVFYSYKSPLTGMIPPSPTLLRKASFHRGRVQELGALEPG